MNKLKKLTTETLEALFAMIEQFNATQRIWDKICNASGKEFDQLAQDYAVATVRLKRLQQEYAKVRYKESETIVAIHHPEYDEEEVRQELLVRQKNNRWTDEEIEEFERLYPTTDNKELAKIFGVTVGSIKRKAADLIVDKDKEWLRQQHMNQ